jgi:histidine ammonia-lyase
MGMTSATKLRSIVDIAEMATAIELLTAAQALEFRLPLNPGRGVKKAYNIIRGSVPPTQSDRSMAADIEKIVELIRHDEFQELLN